MAKGKKPSAKSSKPQTAKQPSSPAAKPQDAAPEGPNITQIVTSFVPGSKDWQTFCKEQKEVLGRGLLLNETGVEITTSGKTEENLQTVTQYVDTYMLTCSFWDADARYGRQHYNGQGPLHIDGVKRLDNQGVMKNAVVWVEELCNRAAKKGRANVPTSQDAVEASKLVSLLRSFLSSRPEEISDRAKAKAIDVLKEMAEPEKAQV